MSTFLRLPAFAALLFLVGCGFHVRGHYQLPDTVGAVFIEVPGYDYDLRHRLHRALSSRGVRLVEDATEADSVLRISDPAFTTRVLSVGTDARVLEHELRYTLGFELSRRDGSFLVAPQNLELLRDISYDESNVLGSQSEANAGRVELLDQSVREIVRRLAARLR
ncbi:MAG: LPS assembly lipoprotein LptE [Immundisolibacter sp.]|uniref:LPS-assembly lipoprotein LptE n=1 Tax=Immundisolibacter sp. TaxID=1934948 RepID=UPI003EDF2BB9